MSVCYVVKTESDKEERIKTNYDRLICSDILLNQYILINKYRVVGKDGNIGGVVRGGDHNNYQLLVFNDIHY